VGGFKQSKTTILTLTNKFTAFTQICVDAFVLQKIAFVKLRSRKIGKIYGSQIKTNSFGESLTRLKIFQKKLYFTNKTHCLIVVYSERTKIPKKSTGGFRYEKIDGSSIVFDFGSGSTWRVQHGQQHRIVQSHRRIWNGSGIDGKIVR